MDYPNYRVQLEGLQHQIRQSEMERQELEGRFEQMMRRQNEKEKWKLKTLKSRYKSFLEEEKQRADRNERLLQTLDRIDFQAASLAAKSGRLKMLKSQYELMLMKNWTSPAPVVSTVTNTVSSVASYYPPRTPTRSHVVLSQLYEQPEMIRSSNYYYPTSRLAREIYEADSVRAVEIPSTSNYLPQHPDVRGANTTQHYPPYDPKPLTHFSTGRPDASLSAVNDDILRRMNDLSVSPNPLSFKLENDFDNRGTVTQSGGNLTAEAGWKASVPNIVISSSQTKSAGRNMTDDSPIRKSTDSDQPLPSSPIRYETGHHLQSGKSSLPSYPLQDTSSGIRYSEKVELGKSSSVGENEMEYSPESVFNARQENDAYSELGRGGSSFSNLQPQLQMPLGANANTAINNNNFNLRANSPLRSSSARSSSERVFEGEPKHLQRAAAYAGDAGFAVEGLPRQRGDDNTSLNENRAINRNGVIENIHQKWERVVEVENRGNGEDGEEKVDVETEKDVVGYAPYAKSVLSSPSHTRKYIGDNNNGKNEKLEFQFDTREGDGINETGGILGRPMTMETIPPPPEAVPEPSDGREFELNVTNPAAENQITGNLNENYTFEGKIVNSSAVFGASAADEAAARHGQGIYNTVNQTQPEELTADNPYENGDNHKMYRGEEMAIGEIMTRDYAEENVYDGPVHPDHNIPPHPPSNQDIIFQSNQENYDHQTGEYIQSISYGAEEFQNPIIEGGVAELYQDEIQNYNNGEIGEEYGTEDVEYNHNTNTTIMTTNNNHESEIPPSPEQLLTDGLNYDEKGDPITSILHGNVEDFGEIQAGEYEESGVAGDSGVVAAGGYEQQEGDYGNYYQDPNQNYAEYSQENYQQGTYLGQGYDEQPYQVVGEGEIQHQEMDPQYSGQQQDPGNYTEASGYENRDYSEAYAEQGYENHPEITQEYQQFPDQTQYLEDPSYQQYEDNSHQAEYGKYEEEEPSNADFTEMSHNDIMDGSTIESRSDGMQLNDGQSSSHGAPNNKLPSSALEQLPAKINLLPGSDDVQMAALARTQPPPPHQALQQPTDESDFDFSSK